MCGCALCDVRFAVCGLWMCGAEYRECRVPTGLENQKWQYVLLTSTEVRPERTSCRVRTLVPGSVFNTSYLVFFVESSNTLVYSSYCNKRFCTSEVTAWSPESSLHSAIGLWKYLIDGVVKE